MVDSRVIGQLRFALLFTSSMIILGYKRQWSALSVYFYKHYQ